MSENANPHFPPELPVERKAAELHRLADEVAGCRLCKLATTRTQTVFGEGDADADLMFIGEGPGRVEDRTGRPFVGPAGELLTRIIEHGVGVSRASVFIANLVKCRPSVDLKFERDRPPDEEELGACSPYLLRQIETVRPKVIVALGGPATKYLLQTQTGITRLRGRWAEFMGIPVMPTYHPSYLLRQGNQGDAKREVWSDIKQVLQKLGWPVPGKS